MLKTDQDGIKERLIDIKEGLHTKFSRPESSFAEIDLINPFTAISRTFASAWEEARIMGGCNFQAKQYACLIFFLH